MDLLTESIRLLWNHTILFNLVFGGLFGPVFKFPTSFYRPGGLSGLPFPGEQCSRPAAASHSTAAVVSR